MEPLTYATLYTGFDGKTHCKDEALPWHPVANVATEPLYVAPLQDATHIGFLYSPVGRTTDWHPALRKQCVMVLTGSMGVEAGDGEKRTFTLLRPIADTAAQERVRDLVLEAYAEFDERSASA